MSDFLPYRSVLLAVLVSSVAVAREPYDKLIIRTQKVSDHPGYPTKLPESKPGMAILGGSTAAAYIVDAFR